MVANLVSRFGSNLDREEAIQECWLFVLGTLLPKLRVKKRVRLQLKWTYKPLGWHNWMLMCLRREISKIRKRQNHNRMEQRYGEED